jgi:hypothetical protein
VKFEDGRRAMASSFAGSKQHANAMIIAAFIRCMTFLPGEFAIESRVRFHAAARIRIQ